MIEQYLIVGVKITAKLQEAMDHCQANKHIYFQENDLEFLQIYNIESEQILGKSLKPGATLDLLNDYVKNIRSIIKKIAPALSIPESEIKVYVHTLIG